MSIDEPFSIDKAKVRIARDLRAIVEMYADLSEQAEFSSDDADIPGGEALMMLGPVANLEAWENRFETAERIGGDTDYANDQLGAEDEPLLVLATWEDALRDERNQPSDLRATVVRAADYIAKSIEFMFSTDEYGDWVFLAVDEVMHDLRRVRLALERVLYSGIRDERTRVPCTEEHCVNKPRLVKVYMQTAAMDFHMCPDCRKRYTVPEYLNAIAQHEHVAEGTEVWLKVSDAAYSVQRPVQTLRQWIKDGKVSTQIVGERPTSIWVLWSDVTDVHREAREVKGRRRIAS